MEDERKPSQETLQRGSLQNYIDRLFESKKISDDERGLYFQIFSGDEEQQFVREWAERQLQLTSSDFASWTKEQLRKIDDKYILKFLQQPRLAISSEYEIAVFRTEAQSDSHGFRKFIIPPARKYFEGKILEAIDEFNSFYRTSLAQSQLKGL